MYQLVLSAAAALAQGDAAHACNQYQAAIAPLDGTSILCGIGLRDGNIVQLRADGAFEVIAEAPDGPEGADRFWVMKPASWNKWLLGIEGYSRSFLYTIGFEPGKGVGEPDYWWFNRAPCGENGAEHVFNEYDRYSGHLLAAYRSTGLITVCAIEVQGGGVSTFTLEQDDYIGPLADLSVEWRFCGEDGGDGGPALLCFSVLGPDGDEWLRYDHPYAQY
ncbi:hypothetical protein [Maricaulis sp.]|uniref:hypothetical protein n=1 Tax=Maricaulis sp. TaxID=1486257 RepID=UPI002632C553|nr:hypothetical protein [Maricaulis sp.]